MPDARNSFWTTLPGILTGTAALITALVGLAALLLAQRDGTPAPGGSTPPGGAVATGDRPAPTAPGGVPGPSPPVLLAVGDSLDVDTGTVGNAVVGELTRGSGQLNLYGRSSAVVPAETDEAGCLAALEARSDGWLTDEQLADGAVVCLTTDLGSVAQARISSPDATGRIDVSLTVWPQ